MSDSKKISILDLFICLLEKKYFFLSIILFFCISGLTISLVSKKYYTSTAVILPPEKSLPSSIGSLASELPVSNLLKSFDLSNSSNIDHYLGILNSRRLAEKVIDSLNLRSHYTKNSSKTTFEDILNCFERSLKVEETDFGYISISVIDTNPALATSIANSIVRELDKINFELSLENAHNSRVFFEDRLRNIKASLDSASDKLTTFQLKFGYIDIEQQAKSSIDALSELEKQKIIMDLKINQLSNTFGSSNQQFEDLSRDRRVLEKQIKNYLENGSGDLIIALKKVPELANSYATLLRDVKVQEAVYRFALQMYEQSKFNEANNMPSIQVLEWAKIPQKKSRPKRAIICLLFFSFGLVIASLLVLARKWFEIQKSENSQTYKKIIQIFSLIKSFR